jgi:predicted O-linked N-acetylglucosamine transferase (SPINDLY family)
VAASLLKAAGLPELIAPSLKAYEAMALKLALEPVTVAAMRQRLLENRTSLPLFDTMRFTRHLEAAFENMYARVQQGRPPEAFAVASGAGR